MKKDKGFTLVELMVSLAIIGILGASAIPALQTFQERARGQEATIMARQMIEGQILYYLENDSFFPLEGETLLIPDPVDTDKTVDNINRVNAALNIKIPQGRPLSYQLENNGSAFQLVVYAQFPLFKDGDTQLIGTLFETGEVIWITAGGSY